MVEREGAAFKLRRRLFYCVGFARTTGQGMNQSGRPYGGVRVSRRMGCINKTGEHSSPLRWGSRQPKDGMYQKSGRTQFAPTVGFVSAEGWDVSKKRANTVRPYGGVRVSRRMGCIKKAGEHSSPLHDVKENTHNAKDIPTTQRTFPQRKENTHNAKNIPTTQRTFPQRKGHSHNAKNIPTTQRTFPQRKEHFHNAKDIPTTQRTFPQSKEHSRNAKDIPTTQRTFPQRKEHSHNVKNIPTT